MAAAAVHQLDALTRSSAQYRYGIVLLLMAALVVFVIAAPTADWSRAVSLGIAGGALVFAIATAREPRGARYRVAVLVGLAIMAVVVVIASGIASRPLQAATSALVILGVPIAISHGVARSLRERGVTVQAVAGALAIYLSIGLVFAGIIGFIAALDAGPYFAQGTDGDEGQRAYFSFTSLTTTGFGDFSPATPAGHAVAVVEMLVGQIYLVTVIGLLIGAIGSRPRDPR